MFWDFFDENFTYIILWIFIGYVSNYMIISSQKKHYRLPPPTNLDIILCLVFSAVWPYIFFMSFLKNPSDP